MVGGDFNTWTLERTRTLLTFAAEHGLDSVLPSEGSGATAARWARLGRPLGLDPGLVLDHLFVRGLEVDRSSARWLSEHEHSDHVPLSVRVRV